MFTVLGGAKAPGDVSLGECSWPVARRLPVISSTFLQIPCGIYSTFYVSAGTRGRASKWSESYSNMVSSNYAENVWYLQYVLFVSDVTILSAIS